MHERYDAATRFDRQKSRAKAAAEARRGLTPEAAGYALGFFLVFAAATFVLTRHFVVP